MEQPQLGGLGAAGMGRSPAEARRDEVAPDDPRQKCVREIERCIYPGLSMVRIWLPADTHRRLLETLPDWSRTHKLLNDATEMRYAVGVRRVIAERVYPESAQLIRIAIRKARTTHSPQKHVPPRPPDLPGQARDLHPQLLPLRALASLHLLVFSFQALHFVDRVRELLRRLV